MTEKDDICARFTRKALKPCRALLCTLMVAVRCNDLEAAEGYLFDRLYRQTAEGGLVIAITANCDPRDAWKKVCEGVDVLKAVTKEENSLGISVHIQGATHKKR